MIAVGWATVAVLVALALVTVLAATMRPALLPLVRQAVWVVEGWLVVLAVVELGLVLRASEADRPDSMVTHLGYVVATAALVPLLVLRPADDADGSGDTDDTDETGDDERVPASPWVLVVALLGTAVCVWRLVETR